LQKPEKPIRSDSWTEIVQLGRQTDVPKVQSYQHECGVPLGGSTSSPDIGWDRANVISSIDADVGDHRVLIALVVGGSTEGISHRHTALEIRDDIGFCVLAVKECPDARRENIKERGKYIPARNGNWVGGVWCSLTPAWDTSGDEKSHPETQLLPLRHVSSFEQVETCSLSVVRSPACHSLSGINPPAAIKAKSRFMVSLSFDFVAAQTVRAGAKSAACLASSERSATAESTWFDPRIADAPMV
jgi:hypothetical protein